MTLLHRSEDKLVANVFPVGMHNSELVLQDEDRNSITELDELSSVSEQNITPSAINIENSTDVIIGPVTQFHGPVTIYQNVNGNSATGETPKTETNNKTYQNGKLVKSESSSSDASHPAEKPNKSFLPQSKHLKYIGIAVVVIIIISVITSCAVILSSKSSPRKPPKPTESPVSYIDTDHTEADEKNIAPILPGSIITRQEWHAIDPISAKKLQHPIPFVIISHTVTPICTTVAKCSQRVRSIQEYHINKGYSDIGYNFLVGSDSNVYVGRGWDAQNIQSSNSISISFIGNYIYHTLTEGMVNVTQELLEEGVRTGKLATDYKLIAHNQTFATESPGRNVYKVIKTWPHFDENDYRKVATNS